MYTIAPVIQTQFDRTWVMFRATIQRFPENVWLSGERTCMIPAFCALHVVSAAEVYSDIKTTSIYSKHRQKDHPLPTQDQLLQYADEVETAIRESLKSATDESLLSPETRCTWVGATCCDRWLYSIRHSLYHLGELSMLLRLAGAEETEWE